MRRYEILECECANLRVCDECASVSVRVCECTATATSGVMDQKCTTPVREPRVGWGDRERLLAGQCKSTKHNGNEQQCHIVTSSL
eukprot:scaffold48861_cov45-Phaeocystis_antarctica.AAC.1